MQNPRETIAATIASIPAPDESARAGALEGQSRLTKPAGALGRLEELAVWLAGVRRRPTPALERKTIVVAAADHGVVEEGVSAYPAEVTAQMVRNFLDGGAAINVLASHAGASVRVIDAGVATRCDDARLHVARLRDGTNNMMRGAAMRQDEAEALVADGIRFAGDCGADVIGIGDMGIGNTTAAAAITSVLTGATPNATTGRGTGVDDGRYEAKLFAVRRAIEVNTPDAADPLDVLAKVGGFEIAFLAGVTLGAAAASVPVVLDGYPTTAAALVAAALAPRCVDYMLASHASAEPGHRIALEHLGLAPLLEFGMRLGEGTGAALAMTLLEAAARIPREMATFDAADVSRATGETRAEA